MTKNKAALIGLYFLEASLYIFMAAAMGVLIQILWNNTPIKDWMGPVSFIYAALVALIIILIIKEFAQRPDGTEDEY